MLTLRHQVHLKFGEIYCFPGRIRSRTGEISSNPLPRKFFPLVFFHPHQCHGNFDVFVFTSAKMYLSLHLQITFLSDLSCGLIFGGDLPAAS